MRTKLDIYVFIAIIGSLPLRMDYKLPGKGVSSSQ